MSKQYNIDGSVLFVSDDNPQIIQVQAKGQSQSQVDTAYAVFQGTWSLSWWQNNLQTQLDNLYNSNYSWDAFIRNGNSTNLLTTLTLPTTMLQIMNNYRNLHNQISSATTVPQVQAININSGWPSNS